MTKNTVVEILTKLKKFKEETGLKIVDSHVHPLDVMGIVPAEEMTEECRHEDYLKPGILERFNYGKFEKISSRIYFKFFQNSVYSIVGNTYNKLNKHRILEEMEVSLTDKSVLLPVEPWALTKSVGDKYAKDSRFFVLGSVDIRSIEESKIETTIKSFVDNYRIVGLKLHPNLQNFKPQPSDNDPTVAVKLRILYETASRYNLYLLFHGGISNFTKKVNSKYDDKARSKTNALLENFCDEEGHSEILGKYGIPVIIAHIGHYGIINPDYQLIKNISDRFSDVYFDTSGVSSKVIYKTLKVMPSSRLIFGSDALYNRTAYNIAFAYEAIMQSGNGEKTEDVLSNILGNNFYNKILRH